MASAQAVRKRRHRGVEKSKKKRTQTPRAGGDGEKETRTERQEGGVAKGCLSMRKKPTSTQNRIEPWDAHPGGKQVPGKKK